jgi:hypothetical protein
MIDDNLASDRQIPSPKLRAQRDQQAFDPNNPLSHAFKDRIE